jgi:hypothetical protein
LGNPPGPRLLLYQCKRDHERKLSPVSLCLPWTGTCVFLQIAESCSPMDSEPQVSVGCLERTCSSMSPSGGFFAFIPINGCTRWMNRIHTYVHTYKYIGLGGSRVKLNRGLHTGYTCTYMCDTMRHLNDIKEASVKNWNLRWW